MEEGWSRAAAAAAAAAGSAELYSELWPTSHQTAKAYKAKHQQAQKEAETGHRQVAYNEPIPVYSMLIWILHYNSLIKKKTLVTF